MTIFGRFLVPIGSAWYQSTPGLRAQQGDIGADAEIVEIQRTYNADGQGRSNRVQKNDSKEIASFLRKQVPIPLSSPNQDSSTGAGEIFTKTLYVYGTEEPRAPKVYPHIGPRALVVALRDGTKRAIGGPPALADRQPSVLLSL